MRYILILMKINSSSDDNEEIKAYFNSIKNFKPLTKEKEKELFFKIKENGDKKARETILQANLKYVVKMAKQYKGCGIPFEDLISEGNIGLIKAMDKFDEKNDVKFYSYGKWWVKASMQEYVKKRTQSEEFEVSSEEMFEPKKLSLSPSLIRRDPFEKGNEKENSQIEENKIIENLLENLNEEEQEIINSTFGLNTEDGKPMTLDILSKKLNLSSERVRQKKEKALRKLRCYALSEYGKINIYK